jgi:hypothetical protein
MGFVGYVQRSMKYLQQQAKKSLEFYPSHPMEQTLFSFKTVEDCEQFIVGSDADIGGYSEAYWGLTPHQTGYLFLGSIVLGNDIDQSPRKTKY